jgi:hypothetical protein
VTATGYAKSDEAAFYKRPHRRWNKKTPNMKGGQFCVALRGLIPMSLDTAQVVVAISSLLIVSE